MFGHRPLNRVDEGGWVSSPTNLRKAEEQREVEVSGRESMPPGTEEVDDREPTSQVKVCGNYNGLRIDVDM